MHLAPRRLWPLAAMLVAGVLGMAWVLQAGAASGETAGGATATAHGVLASGAGLASVTAATGGSAARSAAAAGFVDPLGTVDSVESEAQAGRDATGSAATAEVTARGLSLLGGRVVIPELRVRARAAADATVARAELVEVTAPGATLDGAPVALAPGARVDVPGAGTVMVGEVASQVPGALNVNGLRVTGTAAGAELVVGHLELTATAGPGAVQRPRERRPSPDPEASGGPSAAPPKDDTPETPSQEPSPAAPVTPSAPVSPGPALTPGPAPRLLPGTPGGDGPEPTRTAGGSATRAFPVAGRHGFSDDYGAPRAGTGWHQGNDIFAAVGTPVVAVADGTLSKVGWNTLGGNRLWLTDTAGTGYYYAHLSAYAPIALDGATVRAGEIIAYVGNTGQAATTPSHLHFEVHPGGDDAASVDPYPFLRAWESGTATAFETGAAAVEAAPDAAAGAVVVGVVPERDALPPTQGPVAVSAR